MTMRSNAFHKWVEVTLMLPTLEYPITMTLMSGGTPFLSSMLLILVLEAILSSLSVADKGGVDPDDEATQVSCGHQVPRVGCCISWWGLVWLLSLLVCCAIAAHVDIHWGSCHGWVTVGSFQSPVP